MGVFEGVNFYIAEKFVKDAPQLKNVLASGGGQREFYPSELVSHVICDSVPPPSLGLSRCTASHVLHSDWVYMSSRCGVQLPTAPFTLTGKKLFSNLVFCPSKLPRGDVEKLACLVFYYGGSLQQRLDAAVSHLITMDTAGMKYECAVRHGVKVVTPEWLIDSINMGTLMEEGDYCPRGRGRGHHTHLAEQEEVVQCNGELTENPIGDNQRTTAVISGPMTTEIHHKDHDQTAANCTEAVSMPTETPCVPSPNNQQTTDTSDNVAPLPKTTEGKCEGAEGGWESGGGEGGEEMEIMSGEGELGEESAVSPAPAAHGDITPAASDVSVVNSTTALQNGPTGKKYDKAIEWGVTVVNASFLADIIHNGQIPAVLYSRHTRLGLPNEFLPSRCFEASQLLRAWEVFLQSYLEICGGYFDRETSELVFRSVRRRRERGRGGEGGEGERGKGGEGGEAKRQKMEKREGPPVVMLTGINQSIAKKFKTIIQKLGGRVTDSARDSTHLVAPRVARTVKFLSGISMCHYVVTPEWVEQCERAGELVNEEEFTLRDSDAEETFSMDIHTTLSRARAGKLLQGYCFYATASVQPSHDSLGEIIECAGGELLTSCEVQSRFGRKFEKLASSGLRLEVLSTHEDVAAGLCALFTAHSIPIYNAELVLTGVLKQQLDLSQNVLSQAGTIPGQVQLSSSGTTSGPEQTINFTSPHEP